MTRSYTNNKYKRVAKEILVATLKAGITALEFTAFLADRRPILSFSEYREREYQSYYQSLRRLEKDNLIRLKKQKRKIFVQLTKKGSKIAEQIESLQIPPIVHQKWDGRWRFMAFDILESQRAVRDILRRRIKELGYVQLQKSLFVIPWPCREQIRKIQKLYSADKYIKYFEATTFDGEKELRKKFGI